MHGVFGRLPDQDHLGSKGIKQVCSSCLQFPWTLLQLHTGIPAMGRNFKLDLKESVCYAENVRKCDSHLVL